MPLPVFSEHFADGPYGALYIGRWQMQGERLPVLLLHDSLGCVALWRDFPELLAKATGRTVIAYDRAGFGRSCERDDPMAQDFIRDETREGIIPVMEAMGVQRAVLLGHSVGGGMVTAAAGAHTDLFEAVITEAAQTFVEDVTLEGVRAAKVAFGQPGQIERLERYHGSRARWVLGAWIDTWLNPSYVDWTLREDIARVTSPLLAIHGEKDEFGSFAHPRMLSDGTTGPARLELMPGVGHVPHREQPQAVLELVSGFLSEQA